MSLPTNAGRAAKRRSRAHTYMAVPGSGPRRARACGPHPPLEASTICYIFETFRKNDQVTKLIRIFVVFFENELKGRFNCPLRMCPSPCHERITRTQITHSHSKYTTATRSQMALRYRKLSNNQLNIISSILTFLRPKYNRVL